MVLNIFSDYDKVTCNNTDITQHLPNLNCLRLNSNKIQRYVNMMFVNDRGEGCGWFMVFNTTFNNITVISWRSVLLMEETGVPGENHRPVASH